MVTCLGTVGNTGFSISNQNMKRKKWADLVQDTVFFFIESEEKGILGCIYSHVEFTCQKLRTPCSTDVKQISETTVKQTKY